MDNLNFILPEIFISLSIMFLLLLGVYKKNSSNIVHNLAVGSLLITGILIFNNPLDQNISLFNDGYVVDNLSSFMKILTILGGAFVLSISTRYLKIFKIFLIEYPVLILSSILGMMVMISSNDLMVFYIGLELQSLALYVLASFNRDQLKSSESGLKYFVLSALSSGLLLYGCSLVYGFSGSTNFNVIGDLMNSSHYGLTFGIVFILVGLAFKISAVPFHMWAPDVYEGSPTAVTLFFAIVPKVAALTVFIRFLYIPFVNMIDQWQPILIFLSIASMIFGAIAAIGQNNLKRLIAYSSIGHMGIEQSMYFLAIVGLLSTVIAAFYYLKIIKVIYFDKEKESYDTDHNIWLKGSLTFSTLLILLYFIFPGKLVEIVSRINII